MINQYGEKAANEIIKYSYENSTDPTKEVLPPSVPHTEKQNMNVYQQLTQLTQIRQYNESMLRANSNQRMIPQNVNKFSPAYSRIIAARPKATASANIRLGGVYF
jgi:hypothetical protein